MGGRRLVQAELLSDALDRRFNQMKYPRRHVELRNRDPYQTCIKDARNYALSVQL